MKTKTIIFAILISLLAIAKSYAAQPVHGKPSVGYFSGKKAEIPYIVAKNYFVRNDVTTVENPKIETQAAFEQVFGMAPVMSKDGQPTEIDFSKQFVIAVVLPETDLSTVIKPISLKKNGKNKLVFTYHVGRGQKQTYTIRPCLAIVVDKAYKGDVVLVAQK